MAFQIDTKRALAVHLTYHHGETRLVSDLVKHVRVEALERIHREAHEAEGRTHEHTGRYARAVYTEETSA